jgi:hypothetical protein
MTSLKERLKLYERQAAILENVAKQYPEESSEFVAVPTTGSTLEVHGN